MSRNINLMLMMKIRKIVIMMMRIWLMRFKSLILIFLRNHPHKLLNKQSRHHFFMTIRMIKVVLTLFIYKMIRKKNHMLNLRKNSMKEQLSLRYSSLHQMMNYLNVLTSQQLNLSKKEKKEKKKQAKNENKSKKTNKDV